MERLEGIDLDSARRTSGNGFYYLTGDIARLHSAVLSYARDFMIDRGFTYVVPPFMIHGSVVTGVMSFAEMENMMYKIEGEDLYLIGTSEHSMIGRFMDTVTPESKLPLTLTSYSPCFRKEVGAHGIEERGVYRIHQFEKQEMIVICKPEESADWFVKLYTNTVDFFRSLDIPVRTLECCSGDLADLKVKSLDVEAWSPPPKEIFRGGQLLQPRRRAGKTSRHPHQGRWGQLSCAYAQQHRRRSAAHADRLPRKQPQRGRLRQHPRAFEDVYGRQVQDRSSQKVTLSTQDCAPLEGGAFCISLHTFDKLFFDDIIIYPWGCPGFDRHTDGLVSIPKARLRKNGNLKLNANQNQQIAYAA